MSRTSIGVLGALLASVVSSVAHAAPASFSGRLAAAPCQNAGDIDVDAGEVLAGENAKCAARNGGTITLTDTSVQAGARLHLTASGASAAWGQTSCDPNVDGDCNRCANDVATQFLALFDDYDEDVKSFSFDGNDYYLPAGTQPNDTIMDPDPASHVQGFVRTNSTLRPYAGTHSWKTGSGSGSMFEVKDQNGDLSLAALHFSWDDHPSGAAILGTRMWFGDKIDGSPYVLRSIVVDSWFGTEQAFLELPKAFQGDGPTMGGGVGIAKLESGGYLLVAVGPGANDTPPRTDFFYLIGNPTGDSTLAVLGATDADGKYDMEVVPLGRWRNSDADNGLSSSDSQFQWSENISVITECGSGDVYVINTTNENGGAGLYGSGYYRLSRVDWGPLADHNLPNGAPSGTTGPKLYPLAYGFQDVNEHHCYHRAAATAWVNENHELELYCVEREATQPENDIHFVRRRPNQ